MRRFRREYALLALFILVMLVLSRWVEGFGSRENLLEALIDQARIGVLAAGATLVILIAGIDLSVGSATALSAVALGLVWQAQKNAPLALLAALATGALCGAFNGVLVAKGRMPALIVTLATLSVFRGLAYAVGGANVIGSFPPLILSWSRDDLLGIPVPIWIVAALFVGLGVYLARTDGGRAIYAVGANPAAARISGVPVNRIAFRLYLVSGLLSGLAAILYAAHNNSVRADIGAGDELDAITIVVLGGTSVAGGEGSMAGTALGFLTLTFLKRGITLQGLPGEYHGVAVAILLIGALLLDAWTRRRMARAVA